jgi:hypothetical protein
MSSTAVAQPSDSFARRVFASRRAFLSKGFSMDIGPTRAAIDAAEKMIAQASLAGDLDEAVRLLQEAMGQEDGGVAGIHFSSLDDPNADWREMSPESRVTALHLYLETERLHAVDAESATPGPG